MSKHNPQFFFGAAVCASLPLTWGLGVLDGVQSGTNVVVLGVEQSSQPTTFICEAHGEHLGQGLHQPRVSVWETKVQGQIVSMMVAEVWVFNK